MQRKTKLLAGGAAVLLVFGGLSAVASAHMGGEGWGGEGWGGKGWGGGHGGGMGHGVMGQEMMERYDSDKDGKITQAEIDQNRTQWHGDFDADKNASLSLDEFRALWLKARGEMIVREFQFFDADGNGQVTLEEYRQPLSAMVARRDRNGDGALSPDDRGRRGMGHRWGEGRGMMDDDAPEDGEQQQPGQASP